MRDLIEKFLGCYFKLFLQDAKNYLGLKAVSFALRILQGVRRLLMLQYLILVVCFVCALSFFATVLLLFAGWDAGHLPGGLPLTLFCGALFILSLTILHLSVRESIWMKASGLQTWVDAAGDSSSDPVDESIVSSPVMTREEIENLIQSAVETRLKAKDASLGDRETA